MDFGSVSSNYRAKKGGDRCKVLANARMRTGEFRGITLFLRELLSSPSLAY